MPDIFVFGSNRMGVHGAGAAYHARQYYGAVLGTGEGLQGESYALPTKSDPYHTLSLDEIKAHATRFFDHAASNPQNTYRLTPVGCGLAGFDHGQIAPLFFDAPENVVLPGLWQHRKDGETVRLVIAGGRDYTDSDAAYKKIDRIVQTLPRGKMSEVCGMARGADEIGRKWAIRGGISVTSFPALWDRYGKSAGFVRNSVMANHGTHLIAFWDGKSRGTQSMIELANSYGLRVCVSRYSAGGMVHG